MSRYIEFTTSEQHPNSEFALGSPIHDGNLPARFLEPKGVRVDSRPVEFLDESIPSKLHQALASSRELRQKGIDYNCYGFAALMLAIPLTDPDQNPFAESDFDTEVTADCTNPPVAVNLGILRSNPIIDTFLIKHIVIPAAQIQEPTYLHKLGSRGPVCLSGLEEAKRMYGCNAARAAVIAE